MPRVTLQGTWELAGGRCYLRAHVLTHFSPPSSSPLPLDPDTLWENHFWEARHQGCGECENLCSSAQEGKAPQTRCWFCLITLATKKVVPMMNGTQHGNIFTWEGGVERVRGGFSSRPGVGSGVWGLLVGVFCNPFCCASSGSRGVWSDARSSSRSACLSEGQAFHSLNQVLALLRAILIEKHWRNWFLSQSSGPVCS